MGEHYEYGIAADERQQLDQYKAAYKAFAIMVYMVMALGAFFIIVREDLHALVCGVVGVSGLAVRERYLEKVGWIDYIKERIASDPQVRRRAWRSILIRGVVLTVLWFLGHYTPGKSSVVRELLVALAFATLLSATCWWYEIRAAMKTHGRASAEDMEKRLR